LCLSRWAAWARQFGLEAFDFHRVCLKVDVHEVGVDWSRSGLNFYMKERQATAILAKGNNVPSEQLG
jgi:hypothetical protein